jgi:hypothetical protein
MIKHLPLIMEQNSNVSFTGVWPAGALDAYYWSPTAVVAMDATEPGKLKRCCSSAWSHCTQQSHSFTALVELSLQMLKKCTASTYAFQLPATTFTSLEICSR